MAYLDPGSGSFLIQILIALFLGSAFAIRTFWGRIKRFFLKLLGREVIEEDEEDGDIEDNEEVDLEDE
jgi:hypothetical protein